MIKWFALLIVLVVVAPTFAVEEQHYTGHQYVEWNMDIKSGYIIGYITGIATSQEVLKELSSTSSDALMLYEEFVAATDVTSKIGPLIAGIDAFYADEKNRDEEVPKAIYRIGSEILRRDGR